MSEGCRNVADAVLAHAKRLVHISALGVSSASPIPYACTKAQGEQAIREVLDGTGRALIVRPGLVIGPDDQFINVCFCS
jgi:NADH dehydrogenase